jgi:hypothetical protein
MNLKPTLTAATNIDGRIDRSDQRFLVDRFA